VFVNQYAGHDVGGARRQVLKSRAAAPLMRDHIPPAWRAAHIVHFAPLADEIAPDLVRFFAENTARTPDRLLAATPQGWMRAWDAEGVVRAVRWPDADALLPILDAVIFSEEDIGCDTALEAHYARLARLLVVTRAARGCTLYRRGEPPLHIPAPAVNVMDATGAGDVFAGVFLTLLSQTGQPVAAAEVAVARASESVTRPGLDGVCAASPPTS
jgi:sugar/nucleoside kinase (ribokinase family)